ncbi:MAG TPA: nucleoside triphosphate pyrophosphatase [Patescibacteria group bacterium]|nr:nucleoside triphosphate pyrophosphatase [Patescibacteria group bacterium]
MNNLILASTSPRRKELLEFLGVPFEVVPSPFEEDRVRFEDFDEPADFVATRAVGKALALVDEYPDAIILGADTDVFFDGKVFSKPADLDEAREILKTLRGNTHEVVTAYSLINPLTNERLTNAVSSLVEFFPFSDEELERYISTSEPLGKAGAYAIQMGAKSFVRQVQGSLSNVVGLPLTEVADALEAFGIPIDVDVRAIEEEHFQHVT